MIEIGDKVVYSECNLCDKQCITETSVPVRLIEFQQRNKANESGTYVRLENEAIRCLVRLRKVYKK